MARCHSRFQGCSDSERLKSRVERPGPRLASVAADSGSLESVALDVRCVRELFVASEQAFRDRHRGVRAGSVLPPARASSREASVRPVGRGLGAVPPSGIESVAGRASKDQAVTVAAAILRFAGGYRTPELEPTVSFSTLPCLWASIRLLSSAEAGVSNSCGIDSFRGQRKKMDRIRRPGLAGSQNHHFVYADLSSSRRCRPWRLQPDLPLRSRCGIPSLARNADRNRSPDCGQPGGAHFHGRRRPARETSCVRESALSAALQRFGVPMRRVDWLDSIDGLASASGLSARETMSAPDLGQPDLAAPGVATVQDPWSLGTRCLTGRR